MSHTRSFLANKRFTLLKEEVVEVVSVLKVDLGCESVLSVEDSFAE